MKSQKVTFPGAFGDELAARLELPEGDIEACALFAHCFTCSKDVIAASRISRALAERGIAVLRFDFTGLGGSEGDFENTTFSSNIQDLVAAADYMRESMEAPSILIGHSLGGAAVLRAAHEIDEVLAVATIAAPFDPAHVEHIFSSGIPDIEEKGEAEVDIAGRTFTIRKEFLDDLRNTDAAEAIRSLGVPLLLFHSPVDQTVAVENARLIYEAARHPKSFVSLDQADHLLKERADADFVASVVSAWAAKYVAPDRDTAREEFDEEHAGGHDVIISETGTGKFTNVVKVGAHRFMADEPPAVGGDDTGPSPYELLLASLGACTNMTIRMYAERKGIALDRVEVHMKHEKLHYEDCADCTEDPENQGKIDRIEKEIILHGDLTEDDRERLLSISKRCPVHRTLQAKTTIISGLAD